MFTKRPRTTSGLFKGLKMSEICKGKISTIEASPVDESGHSTHARVFSLTGGSVTRPLVIPWWLRGSMGNLKTGDEVVYVLFEDMTGYILGRFDGHFQTFIPYDPIVDGNVKVTGNQTIEGDESIVGNETVGGNSTVTGNSSAADFVSGSYGSTNSHTHTDSLGGKTTSPA